MKPLVFGYDNVAADFIWLKTISYFADQFVGGQDYKYLLKLLYIISDLDPMFEKAYLWGGSILMYNGNWITAERVNNSTEFLKHGWNYIKNSPDEYKHNWEYWRIPHMIGFNYAIELRDIEKGIPYIEEVAKIKDAPAFYRTWVSTLYKKSGKKQKAVNVLERELIVEQLRGALSQKIDESLKKKIMRRLKRLYKDLYDEKTINERIEELIAQTSALRNYYVANFPYLEKEMFFAIGANKSSQEQGLTLVDMLYFEQ